MLSLDENAQMLTQFGLTFNQAKVYIATAQLKIASVGQISKLSRVRREDVYRILPKLEKMGLIERRLGRPVKMVATPVEDALSILIKREQDAFNKKLSTLLVKKEEFLKYFKSNETMSEFHAEETHFALISNRERILSKGLEMINKAEKEINIITSKNKFIQGISSHAKPFKNAMKKDVKIRILLGMTGKERPVLKLIERHRLFEHPFELKITDQPSGHYKVIDQKEALIATSIEQPLGENPYLWTNDRHLVGLLKRNFEDLWYNSINLKNI